MEVIILFLLLSCINPSARSLNIMGDIRCKQITDKLTVHSPIQVKEEKLPAWVSENASKNR